MTHHANMKPNYKKRDYLLPKGCTDLIDVLKPKAKHQQKPAIRTTKLPPISGEIAIADWITVGELAEVLKQKPSKIIADFLEIGWDANLNPKAPIELIHIVIRLYGIPATRAA